MLRINICDDREEHLQTINAAQRKIICKKGIWMPIFVCLQMRWIIRTIFPVKAGRKLHCWIFACRESMEWILRRKFEKRADQTEIIFLTTSSEYAVDAFHLKAAHYLVKPFTQIQFEEAMDRAMEHFSQEERAIAVKSEGGEMYSLKLMKFSILKAFHMIRMCICKRVKY